MRVVIADDSALLREGLARLMVEAGVEVCATVGEAVALAAVVAEHRPDIAVIDIRMPPSYTHEGAAAAVELRTTYPELGILLLSQAVETHFAGQLLDRHRGAVRLPAQGPGHRRTDPAAGAREHRCRWNRPRPRHRPQPGPRPLAKQPRPRAVR